MDVRNLNRVPTFTTKDSSEILCCCAPGYEHDDTILESG